MLVIGLTGSIGMGKSTVAGWFRDRGFPVADSDKIVHDLYSGAAVAPIEASFPGTTSGQTVDRAKLSAALVDNPAGFERLEAIVHPLVRQAQSRFLDSCFDSGEQAAVLEIPLLFETRADARVDVVVVANATAEVQRARVLARPGMTQDKLAAIVARQTPAEEKVRRADFVVDTGTTLAESEAQVEAIAAALRERKGTVYQRLWRQAKSAICVRPPSAARDVGMSGS